MKRLVLLLLACTRLLAACGPDGCDPTGLFGCEQKTTHPTVDVTNQASTPLQITLHPDECSKGGETWTVGANAHVAKSLTIVRSGGGDPCESDRGVLSVYGASFTCSLNFKEMDPSDATFVCSESGCAGAGLICYTRPLS